MSQIALQSLIGTALIDRDFCKGLLNKKRPALLAGFDLTGEEKQVVTAIEAGSIREFVDRLYEWLKDQDGFAPSLPASAVSTRNKSPVFPETGQKCPDDESPGVEVFLVESLAHGLLGVYGVEEPPVPVQGMIQHPLPIFEHLTLLELRLGLYDVAYRSLLNGSRVIVVDPDRPPAIQRVGVARELYVAFCHSSRAAELRWPNRRQPSTRSNFFARCLLMPTAWVQRACAVGISLEDLAERFGVPVPIVARRLQKS